MLEAGEGRPLDLTVVAKGLGTVKGQVLARVAGGPDETRPGATVKIDSGSYKGNTLADAVFPATAGAGPRPPPGRPPAPVPYDGEPVDLDVYLRDSGRVTGRVVRS